MRSILFQVWIARMSSDSCCNRLDFLSIELANQLLQETFYSFHAAQAKGFIHYPTFFNKVSTPEAFAATTESFH